MISAGEFRNGVTFEQDGQVLQVVEFQHVKPGKGAAFVRTKTKNVITGSVVETSYNPTAKFPQAFIERREVTYSYEDGDLYYFMDNETYEQIPVAAADVPENFKFCKENEICKLLSYKGKVFSVEIPNFIELEVTETEPGFKGNTATNTLKPAKVETGAEIRVPLFINGRQDPHRYPHRRVYGARLILKQMAGPWFLPRPGFFGKLQKQTPCLQCVKEVFPYGYGSECKGRLHPRYDERDGV